MPIHTRRIHSARSRLSNTLDRWLRPLQQRGALTLLVLSILATTSLLYTLPMVWVGTRIAQNSMAWQDAHWARMQSIGQHWSRVPSLRAFRKGDEAEVRELLREHPLLVSVVSRADGTVWSRDGERLRPAGTDSAARRHGEWVRRAIQEAHVQWIPPKEESLEGVGGAELVLLGDVYGFVNRWRIGSPEVERCLRLLQPDEPRLQVGLRRADAAGGAPAGEPHPAWSAPPNLQASFAPRERSPIEIAVTGDSLGEGWELVGRPLARDREAMKAVVWRHQKLAWSAYALVAGGLSLGLYLRYRARRQERVDADRIASLAHSLKTPLAVLKLRCDTLRMGLLSQRRAEAEFIRIGEEVDQLVVLIESGLKAVRAKGAQTVKRPVPTGFYQEAIQDLESVFEQEGRALEVQVGPEPHRAHLSSLRVALATLLENALVYGRGTTRLRGEQQGRTFVLSVTDEGPGLSEAQLENLGKPFLRFRDAGAEGFLHEGQGLGLSLLFQVAGEEGWGLVFRSGPGEGFEARIELPWMGA